MLYQKVTPSLLILLYCLFPIHSYSQWEWQNPLPQGNNLNWVRFVDDNTAFAVGDKGTIMKTTDKGLTWEQIYFGYYQSLTGIFFVNSQLGYAVGSNKSDHWGYAFKTTDGGSTWTQLPVQFGDEALCVWFINEKTGYVGTYWALYKTIDGGENWSLQTSPPIYTACFSILFTDSLTGYLGGWEEIYKTTDGGNTWNISYFDPNESQFSLCFTTHDTGFAVSHHGTILKTTNAGQTWAASSEPDDFTSIFFSSPQTGIIAGSSHLYRTTDSGNSWQPQSLPVPDLLWAGSFADSMNAIVVGNHGATVVTNNDGLTWEVRSSYITTNNLTSLFFTSQDVGYAAGDAGTILKTNDGGNTWQNCYSGTNKFLYCLYFSSPDVGYVCGFNNAILKTIDGGSSWFPIYSSTDPHEFTCIQFPSQNIGYCLYEGLLKTMDAGNSWYIKSPPDISNNSMYFTTIDTGYFCGKNGQIRMTPDGGDTYISLNSGVSVDLISIYFPTGNVGFVTGNNLILKTYDAGNTWEIKYSGSFRPWNPHSINFSDLLHGYLIGWDTILRTKDGGETWQSTSTCNFYLYPINSIWFSDSLTGYIAGENGSILKTKTGGVISGIKKKSGPERITVFPNPNDGKFYFELNGQTDGEIEVYSLNGKLIYKSELFLNQRPYMVDLRPCKPGIYFLRIRVHDRIFTGKVLAIDD
ncbi:MAG TPA: YCF48-related protein [Bacteroidales bacterium]|nr:YCF48-related protein [Bacteroidales bacterium]